MAIFFGFGLAITLWMGREDPELLAERLSYPIQEGQPLWDKVFIAAITLLFVLWLVLMPLDAVRFGWSEVPGWLRIAGAIGLILSFCIVSLTFRENAYLAPVVKLQEERGQTVVTTGPYRYVRHPMYTSMLLFFPGSALLLGSWGGPAAVPRASEPARLENRPRRPDAEERAGRIRPVRTQGEVPAHPSRLVTSKNRAPGGVFGMLLSEGLAGRAEDVT